MCVLKKDRIRKRLNYRGVHIEQGSFQRMYTCMVIAKGDAQEVGRTISDSSQYLACIMCINLFSASIRL